LFHKGIEKATIVTAFVIIPEDVEKYQDDLIIAVNKYSVGQGPDLATIQTIDVLKEVIKDKDALLFMLEVRAFDPLFEIGGKYAIPEGLLCFRKNAKKVVEWV